MGGCGVAWLTLCVAFAIHVGDEALPDFLSVYDLTARAIRARFPFLSIPTFTFRVWLAGLVVAVLVLASLTPLAFRGSPALRPVAYVYGIVMAGNGVLHLTASLWKRRPMPGTHSAPVILAGAIYLLPSVARSG